MARTLRSSVKQAIARALRFVGAGFILLNGGVHFYLWNHAYRQIAVIGPLRPAGRVLRVDPRIPEPWESLEIPLRFKGSRVRLRMDQDHLQVRADPPTTIRVGGEDAGIEIRAAEARFRHLEGHWEVVSR